MTWRPGVWALYCGDGYESDNHAVGHYLTMGQGAVILLVSSAAAPEPLAGRPAAPAIDDPLAGV